MGKCIIEYVKEKCLKKTSNYHHGNLKEELLKQAVQIIQEKGVDAVTLQVLATELGTSRSAIYRHFRSKNELMHNVILYGFEMFDAKISPIFMQSEETVTKRLYLMGKEYIKFALDHPNLYRMLFGEKFKEMREENCTIEEDDPSKGFQALVGLLMEGQSTNQFCKTDPMFQAQTIHANVHGLASLSIDGHIHVIDNIDELYEASFNTLTNGLLEKN
jgi:AcrR family transcriptional regulator